MLGCVQTLPTRSVRAVGGGGLTGPAQVLATAFAAAIALGTVLLALPVAHAPGAEVGLLDALFTATSAVCVTGLSVLDVSVDLSRFGQTVLLLLFQLGGFGILTFGALAFMLVGQRAAVQQRLRLQAQVEALELAGVVRFVGRIALLVVAVEGVATLLTWPRFAAQVGPWEGLYQAAFHAVSAFTNAGFDVTGASLAPYRDDGIVLTTLTVALVLGAFGYFPALDLWRRMRRPRRRLLLHTRIAAVATGALLLLGWVGFAALEWSNPGTLGGLPWPERLGASMFQGATPRTAGLQVVEAEAFRPATTAFVMLLMFIGGNPGSTAGGVKTVTVFVLLAGAWSLARGRADLQVFGRRISRDAIVRAAAVAFLATLAMGLGATVLLLTDGALGFREVAFEAVSALGTVGLSMGITPDLSAPGRVVVIVLMFVGRLGPLTVALAMVGARTDDVVRRPTEEVLVG